MYKPDKPNTLPIHPVWAYLLTSLNDRQGKPTNWRRMKREIRKARLAAKADR